MAGIVAAGVSIPRYRLPRELIAQEWGGHAAGGEKAVANHDEDSLTLAVNAALAVVGDGPRPDAVSFATTTSPYAEKQVAATIATVLDLPPATRTLDFTDTLRAGTSAILAALDAIAGGSARRVLVAAADCRVGDARLRTDDDGGAGVAGGLLARGVGLADAAVRGGDQYAARAAARDRVERGEDRGREIGRAHV